MTVVKIAVFILHPTMNQNRETAQTVRRIKERLEMNLDVAAFRDQVHKKGSSFYFQIIFKSF